MKLEIAGDTDTVFQSVVALIRELVLEEDITIEKGTRFFEDLNFDSILTMQLLVAAEEKFSFDAEDSEESLQAFETVGAFVQFVNKMIQETGEME
ncbi:MAG: phosphopantetheine-binding protein [Clostridium sp.]|nr:phosphopantetheine-binding protein [Clostridium sp.]